MKIMVKVFVFICFMQAGTSINEGYVAPITTHLPGVAVVVPQQARS